MTDTATLEARLAEAETALHQLEIGGRVVRVRASDGKQVEYAAAEIGPLRAYVASLKRQLGKMSRGRAIGVTFR